MSKCEKCKKELGDFPYERCLCDECFEEPKVDYRYVAGEEWK